jgi:hypothetical protein
LSYYICVQSKYSFYSSNETNFVTLGGANYSAIATPLSYINTRVSAEMKFLNGILVKVSGHKSAFSQTQVLSGYLSSFFHSTKQYS